MAKTKAPSAQKKQGISSQNVKVTKKSTSTPKKSVAAAPLNKKSEVKEPAVEQDDFEKFASTDEEFESSSEEEAEGESFLEGFESTDDESEEKPSEDFDAETGLSKDSTTAAEQKKTLAHAKARAAQIKDTSSQDTQSEQKSKNTRGVLYIGRIPHGFYEDQMRAYFGQFGAITKLRLSRNKRTGKSKHYAFIEFESADVAKVVADTMDNYLLFGHILKVKLMAEDQVRDDLFVGANQKFKAIPWNELNHQKANEPKTRKFWEDVQAKDKERREKSAERLKSLGINYSYSSPVAKSATPVKAAPVKETTVSDATKSAKLKSKKKKASKKA